MEKTALYKDLADFLTNEPSCQKALFCLNSEAQIAINVGGTLQACVSVVDQKIQVHPEECPSADFVFYSRPEAIELMISEKGLSAGALCGKLVKQVLTQQIELTMPGHFLQVVRKGYLNILKVGGMELLVELRKHNLASLPKIIEFLRALRKA